MKLNKIYSPNSAFNECRQIEARGWDDLEMFIKTIARNGQFVVTDKGNLSEILQQTIGDGLFNDKKDGGVWCFELKTEETNKYNNLFLEFWSNLSRFNPGWLLKLNTDILFYQFLSERQIYCVSFNKLRKWAFQDINTQGWPGRLFDFPLKQQTKYSQLNDTWGFCVPISILEKEIGMKLIAFIQENPVVIPPGSQKNLFSF